MKKNLVPFIFRLVLIQCVIFLSFNVLFGQNENKTLSPYFVVIGENSETDNLPLKETSASINIVGVIADVTVKQVYVNSGKNTLEAIYTFPLSTKAAVYAMQMSIGARKITAKISEKEKARKDYEEAKAQGKRSSLLEQSRPNVFTMNVANIIAGDTIVVELKYTELLVPENGIYSFVYPTVVGPRYSNKSENKSDPDGAFVSSPYTKSGILPAYKFGIEMKIHSGIPIQDINCPTHKIIVGYSDLNSASIKLDPGEINGGNRDLILNYSLQGNKIESGLMTFEGGDENFFLLMVQPPKKVLKEEIPPREYIFIVDVSGSMNGFPLDISKNLMRNLILNLSPKDMFNVVLFAGSTGVLSDISLEANQSNLEKAIRFIDKQSGRGGTELLPALKRAFMLPQTDFDVSRSFVIATDGYVDIENDAFDFIRENSGSSNFFSFGIGSSVNRYLIEGMAFMGNGEPMVVENKENASRQAGQFRNYINTPVLTRINVDYGGFDVYDVEPISISDMMAERPIVIFGKYKGNASGDITIKGRAGRQSYKQSFDVSLVKPSPAFSAIKYLWARDQIKLLGYYDKNGSNSKEITELGLKYNLMTNYTSFIAIDEQVIKDSTGKIIKVKQPLPLPKGVSDLAVSNGMNIRGARSLGNVTFVDGVKTSKSKLDKDMAFQEEEQVFYIAEQMPSFPGGEDSLKSFIQRNLVYPEKARVSGKVFVSFIIEANGSLTEIAVIRGVDPALDKEAIRLVKSMPKWIPGIQAGKPVRVKMIIPINFILR